MAVEENLSIEFEHFTQLIKISEVRILDADKLYFP